MSLNKIIKYNPKLKERARYLRKNSTLAEILFWKQIKGKFFGYEFHRQVPIDEFIVDFYCHELKLAVEIDGISHNENKYDYDMARGLSLKKIGVEVIRFDDVDVKKNLESVLLSLKSKIKEIEEHPP